ncbi:hypothetical protein BST81_08685 [Leptolyngbya sp. 'hensonii']|uniref:O-linked N-acetylglucosamine transferase family protein n=1 Tax=Leptolyngbya sp. 'hensonii' TaxID=1922337 RepID=UPI00094FD758|nr:tetratricopeptide repeat protein [Leptolyngbya sp. 'hensonii']OLP18805.1 hypothetical protein BST81_08685 [Leptolyngbya sp. 'hensonii']
MDYQNFLDRLPQLYEDWQQSSVRPKSPAFRAILEDVSAMTTPNVMQLLNHAVSCLEPGEVYCEVGTYQGSTLIGALLNHPDAMAYAIDNFSEFDPTGENEEKLLGNLARYGLQEQVLFCNQEFEAFFLELGQLGTEDRIGVYLYDGAHDYRSQIMGLLAVRPFLADRALIVIDDSNWKTIQQAIWDFIAVSPACQFLLELPTPVPRDPTFWNGLYLLSWDVNRPHDYDWSTFSQVRHRSVIQAIYELQVLEQRAEAQQDLYTEARDLHSQQQYDLAEQKYRQFLLWNQEHAEAWLNLGLLYCDRAEFVDAMKALVKALELDPEQAIAHYALGRTLEAMGHPERAILAFETAIGLAPNLIDALVRLARLLFQQQRLEQAKEIYQRLRALQVKDGELYLNLGECLRACGQPDGAIALLQEGVAHYPTEGGLHFALVMLLRQYGYAQAAIEAATAASLALPEDYTFDLLKYLLLPLTYDRVEEIEDYRQRFTIGLQRLVAQTDLTTLDRRQSALAGIGRYTNFYLTYQNQNDLVLQCQYGDLVHRIMAANYPDWVQPLPMPSLATGEKIRVGYASAYLHSYSGTLWLTGWLRYADRQNFEIYCYYTGNQPDPVTEQFRQNSDVFHHIPHNLEAVCGQILADRLHVLVFPEIGMDPQTLQMAALRLAPMVCTAWGHPMTSGLPTVDYYLSGDLMEPEQGETHYRETLIRLPHIGVSYPRPAIPELTKDRSDLQLREDGVVYLCCQAPFKYLPQHDYLLIEIAQRVPQAQFVFLRVGLIQGRLERAFAAANLNCADFCLFLPSLPRNDYLMLNLLSDVYLDSIGFSGGNTTLDAIACALPVVTLPDAFMRGHLSAAMLRRLGLTETIAGNEQEYIDLAVTLGLDSTWRGQIRQQMEMRSPSLYHDRDCVLALESFWRQVVQGG